MDPFRAMFGPVFKGYQGHTRPEVMDRAETDHLSGVVCGDGNVRRAPGTVRNTDYGLLTGYSAGMSGSEWINAAGVAVTGRRFSILGSFKLTNLSAEQYIFGRTATVSGSDYQCPALSAQTDGTLKLYYRDDDGTDKTITSTLTVSAGTTYHFMVRRLDGTLDLWIAEDDENPASWAETTTLDEDNAPGDSGTHGFVIGADGAKANGMTGDVDAVVILEIALEDASFIGIEWPQPKTGRCALSMGLGEAVGAEFVDDSARSLTITHAAGVTHRQTALTRTVRLIQLIGETVDSDSRRHSNVVAAGQLYAVPIGS